MSSGEIIPGNPATLAESANEQLFFESVIWEDGENPDDHAVLIKLGNVARELEFTDRAYYVMTNRALAIPDSIKRPDRR